MLVNVVETIVDRIEKAITAVMDNFIRPKIELAAKLMNKLSGQDRVSVAAHWERAEQVGI